MENHLGQIVLIHRLSFANTVTFDKPLDLSLPKNQRYHGKENDSSHVPIKRQKVMARLWQTREVMWSEGSAQPFVSDSKPGGGKTNGAPVMAITPESIPMIVKSNDGNQRKDHGLKDLISGDLGRGSQPKKRNRFSITQLFLLEKVFEIRMFLRPSETQGLARLLDVEECRVSNSNTEEN